MSRRSVLRWSAAAGAAAAGTRLWPAAAAGSPAPAAFPALRPALEPQPDFPPPPIVTRVQWGADEAIRESGRVYDPVVEKLIVHHTVTPNNPADPSAVMRSVYRYHVSGEYIDIAYNWCIDHEGRIYEGRWARDYPAGTPHTGENRRGRQVRGGHTYNHNTRTCGVAFLGTHTTSPPTAAAMEALVSLLTWKCARWGIDPQASDPYTNYAGQTLVLPNIMGHRDARPTTCPGDPVLQRLPDVRAQVAARVTSGPPRGTSGYWIAAQGGATLAFGSVPDQGDTRRLGVPSRIQGIASHPRGRGYWLLGTDGGVFTFGEARFHGSTGGMRLWQPVVGMVPTPTGEGYWLVARDGGIFTFGDAGFHGSTGAIALWEPIVGMAATPSGRGYWLVARDGGIFAFGDATFRGSMGGRRLAAPIVGMAASKSGRGYWLAAADGGVFAFGDAAFKGSAAGRGVSAPIVGITATTTGRGYALVGRDGAVHVFGDAPFYGSAWGRLSNVVGLAGRLKPRR